MEHYGRRITVDLPFDVATTQLTEVVKEAGLTVLSCVDVRSCLDRTLHHDFQRYVLFQVALPRVILDALREDLCVGAILPTTIAVFELADGETAVVVADPFAGLVSEPRSRQTWPALAALADATSDALARALADLDDAARWYAGTPPALPGHLA